ncbi:hypothetical protein [Streptosporangium roseum]|uniref:hypothetical protein n=1 Tax=Streptosporangium roseum TaxID=2001 RepID=UPI00332B8F02
MGSQRASSHATDTAIPAVHEAFLAARSGSTALLAVLLTVWVGIAFIDPSPSLPPLAQIASGTVMAFTAGAAVLGWCVSLIQRMVRRPHPRLHERLRTLAVGLWLVAVITLPMAVYIVLWSVP